MGRKNHKGRTANQNPRRFYRSKREQRALDSMLAEQSLGDRLAGGLTADAAALHDPTGATIGALPRPGEWDAREVRPRANTATRTCGRCAEWTSRAGLLDAAARGECLHPGSGFSYPPANMEACPFFH